MQKLFPMLRSRWFALLMALAVVMQSTAASASPAELQYWNGTAWVPVTSSAPLPVLASVSASISGFTAATTGTPISVTSSGVSGTLPAGAVVVATNVGGTNGAYCSLGASATTSSQYLPPGGGWFAFTVGASTQLTCITSTSTTTVNTTGGAGLPTGAGGTGGAGSSSNASVSATGNSVPASATYLGINIAGTLTGLTAGQATMVNSVPVVIASNQSAVPVSAASLPLPTGAATSANQGLAYPVGAVAITASATGTTAATTATLAGTSGKTTYICSYSVRANATAAATVTDTVTGVITATMSSILWVAPLASGLGVDEQIFTPCVPASGTNVGIAVVSGAPGSGGTVSVHAAGYQQ